jgi:hypothetical protein
MVSWFFLSSSPLGHTCAIAGPEEAKNLAGRKGLRLIQIRLAILSLARLGSASQENSDPSVNRSFQFQKRSQLFIGTHDDTPSVTMRVNYPNCAPRIVER